MVEVIINGNRTNIKTNDLEINIEGSFEIKKEGDNAPTLNVIANSQQRFEQLKEQARNA